MKSIKTLLFSFLFFCVNNPLLATQLDSLLNVLSSKSHETTEEGLDEKSILCNNIAVLYQGLHEDKKARFYFMQAIEFTERRIKKQGIWDAQNNYDMASLYQNLGVFESTEGNIDQAELYMAQAESYYQRLQLQISKEEYIKIILSFYRSNFTRAYHAESYEEAEKYMDQIRATMIQNQIPLSPDVSRLHGELLRAQGRNDEAILYMIEALELYDAKDAKSTSQEHQIIHSYISVLYYLGRYDEALGFLNERVNYRSFEEVEQFGMEPAFSETDNYFNTIFIRSYILLANWRKTKDTSSLEAAFQWQKLGFKLAENYILTHNADKLDQSVSTAKNKVFALIITAVLLQNENKLDADAILDLLRIVDLYQSARLHLERISYAINKEAWEEQKMISAEIEYVSSKLEELANVAENEEHRDSLSNRSYELSLKLTELDRVSKQAKILDEYRIGQGGFHGMIKAFVAEKNATVISYFYENENDSLFIIGCDPKGNFLVGVAVPNNLNQVIMELYGLNGRFLMNQADLDRQEKLNRLFYTYLIAPIRDDISTNNLVIYPIEELGYISFDALKNDENNYLVEDFSISYTSSLFSLFDVKNTKNLPKKKNQFSAFYPANYGTDSLTYLFNAKTEIDEINAELDGKIYEGNAASKSNFLTAMNESSILHIASHSLLDVDSPYESAIVFDRVDGKEDNKLYAYEIFSKTINADLIILSSCNSAHGKIEQGIGVVSLSNAFFFAGTPSTMSSLWSAQDLSSSEIMIEFYKQLKLGQTKSASLRAAKLAYLEKADKIKSQPFFWANYVIYGSDEPLFEDGSNSKWYNYLIGIAATITLFLIGRRYLRSPSKA